MKKPIIQRFLDFKEALDKKSAEKKSEDPHHASKEEHLRSRIFSIMGKKPDQKNPKKTPDAPPSSDRRPNV